ADEGGLDLPELDAVAADLHLAVDAPEVFEIAVRQPAGEIPRAVEARAGSPPGIGNEALRRQLRPPEISRCNPLSPDGDLARDADGLGREAAVDDVQREIGDGSAENAAGRQVASPDGPTGHVDGRLGDAVHVDEKRLLVAVAVEPGPQSGGLQGLAAENHESQGEVRSRAREDGLLRPEKLPEGGRRPAGRRGGARPRPPRRRNRRRRSGRASRRRPGRSETTLESPRAAG